MNTSIYKLADNVLFQKVAEETVILEPETGEYFTLDAVGTFMIETLQSGRNMKQTLLAINDNFDTNGADIAGDLTNLVAEMQQKGLLIEA
jgi:methionine synthase I (cobalamin-dependent)